MSSANGRSVSHPSQVDIPKVFADYLRGPAAVRNELTAAYPLLLTSETLPALDSAVQQLDATREETNEVVRAIEGIRNELDLPEDGGVTALQPEERHQLQDPEAIIQLFAANLAGLLAKANGGDGPLAQSSGVPTSSTQRRQQENAEGERSAMAAWHRTPALVLAVLSFLSIEEVLTTAEDVCRAWRFWLFQPECSKYFWIEAVQREYPVELGVLIQTQGSDIMHSDWRTIAMLMCTADGDADGAEELGD